MDETNDPAILAPLVSRVATDYAAWDTVEAISFIARVPNEYLKQVAVETLSKEWSKVDPVAASQWIADLPAGKLRDVAAKELVAATVDDPERAFENAAAIADPELRINAALQIAAAWKKIDYPYIAKIIANSRMSTAEQEQLLQTVKK